MGKMQTSERIETISGKGRKKEGRRVQRGPDRKGGHPTKGESSKGITLTGDLRDSDCEQI